MVFNMKDMIALPFVGIWVVAALITVLHFLLDLCRSLTTGLRTPGENHAERPLLESPHG